MITARFIMLISVGFLLSSCKDGKPELTSLLGGKVSPSTTAPYTPKGRVTLGSAIDSATIGGVNYNVRSRVVVVPQNQVSSASIGGVNYTIRGKVGL
jgi:hypothetical protein